MFSPSVFISIGDEYDKKDSIPDRYKGKSMLTSSTKRGFVQDALFQKSVQSLSEGDKYVEPGYFDKRYRMENEKRKITAEGFRYSNPSHKSTGAGDYFGTFSEKNPHKHEVEFAPPKQGEASAKALAAPRNVTTNPSKRGTYGFANLTIGEPIKYISDPYDAQKRSEALAEKGGTRAIVAGTAFRAAVQKQDYFDQTPHGVPKIYTLDKPLPARKAAAEEKKPELRTPFRPGGSLVPSITKRPAYIEDPYELKEKQAREAKKNEKPTVAWKPLGSSKSLPVRPIKFTPA